MKKVLMMCLLGLSFASCEVEVEAEGGQVADNSPRTEQRDLTGPLGGSIDGKAWSALSGKVEEGFEDGTFRVTIFAEESENPCNLYFSKAPTILFEAKAETGMEYLSFSNTVTMAYTMSDGGSMNMIATEGHTDILTINDDTVEIEVNATADGSNSVGGRVTLTRCDN